MNKRYGKIVLCKCCREAKHESEFYKSALNKKSDTAARCIECVKDHSREYRAKNRDYVLYMKKKYYSKNKEKSIKEYLEKNKERIRQQQLAYRQGIKNEWENKEREYVKVCYGLFDIIRGFTNMGITQ